MNRSTSRRTFLKASAASIVGAGASWSLPAARAQDHRTPSEQLVFGFIGTGIRYGELLENVPSFGPAAAICDVDGAQLRRARKTLEEIYAEEGMSIAKPMMCQDYRRILDRSDIDVVVIAVPDHWHTKVAIDAMRAGKDVYCEKPLTLTIEDGRQILKVLDETGRIFQVGTQQRSGRRFQQAAALLRAGRIGTTKRLTCAIGGSPTSPSLPVASPPSELNWNRWLGPTKYVEYRTSPTLPGDDEYGSEFPFSRCHAHFRWWYEYAGGKLTDWGAHHIDIAMWALDKSDGEIGQYTIDPIHVAHPVEFVDGYPVADDRFNTATEFHSRVTFADGVELDIVHDAPDLGFDNGIMFQGSEERFFVNRGKLTGKPAEDLANNPLPDDVLDSLYPGLAGNETDPEERVPLHMKNFVQCVKSRQAPISEVASHHRHLSLCHAVNISLRLGRKLTFDPSVEQFVDDDQANTFLAREPRKGFEIES